jgi:hypothetical protein
MIRPFLAQMDGFTSSAPKIRTTLEHTQSFTKLEQRLSGHSIQIYYLNSQPLGNAHTLPSSSAPRLLAGEGQDQLGSLALRQNDGRVADEAFLGPLLQVLPDWVMLPG